MQVSTKTTAAKKCPNQPRAAGRRERKAAETRLALFRAAVALFAERGFHNVTVEDITEAADVGKGTFFNYFRTKEHVLGALPEIQLAKVEKCVRSAMESRQSVHSTFRVLMQQLLEEPGRSPELARTLVSSFLTSAVVRELLEEQMRIGRDMVAELVALGQKRGEIAPELNRKAIALQFQQAALGTILLWSLYGKPSLTRWAEDSLEHFWRAIAVRKQR